MHLSESAGSLLPAAGNRFFFEQGVLHVIWVRIQPSCSNRTVLVHTPHPALM